MNTNPTFEWLHSKFVQNFVEQLGWVLIQSLWQFAFVALLTGVAVRAMHRSSAAMRYIVLVAAMAVLVAVPIATWILQPNAMHGRSANPTDSSDRIQSNADAIPKYAPRLVSSSNSMNISDDDVTGRDLSREYVASEPPPVLITPNPTTMEPTQSWSEYSTAAMRPCLAWIVAGWIVGVVLCALRPLLSWQMLLRLRRVGVSAASDEVLAALGRVSERLGHRQVIRVLQSTLIQVPVVVGYVRPVILLPVSLLTRIPPAQLEAILAHELAHVRRHDFIVNMLQTLIETLFFYHPAMWWLSHQIRVEREHCCDDLAVASLGNRVEYGRALLAIAELRGQSNVLVLGATDGSLLFRIRRILGVGPNRTAVCLSSLWPVVVLCLAFLGMSVSISMSWHVAAKDEGETNPRVTTESNSDSDPDDETKPLRGSEAIKTMLVELTALLPHGWKVSKFEDERTIKMTPGSYLSSDEEPHVAIIFADGKARPKPDWEREDEQYEYLGETPHGHAHLFVSMRLGGQFDQSAFFMDSFDWPEAADFCKAFIQNDGAKVAALKNQADDRYWARDGWGLMRNGMRIRWVNNSKELIVGKPLDIGLQIFNFSSEPRTFDPRQADPDRSWQVIGPDGNPVEFHAGGPHSSGDFFTLKPTTYTHIHPWTDFEKRFDLSKPGRYTLKFTGEPVRDSADLTKLNIPEDKALPGAKDLVIELLVDASPKPE